MEIICLANSFKHQGRCIAGIDRKSGQWVRPVSDLDDGRIPIDSKLIPVDRIRTLDILSIPIDFNKTSGHEIENLGYENSPWQIIGQAEVASLLKYCEQELLFPNYGKAIPYEDLEAKAPVRTLQLLEVKSFICRRNSNGKWRGVIADKKYNFVDIDLSITDPIILEKLNRNESISSHCLLCLSLSQPFQKEVNGSLLCYRLIAGVIEILPELELISREMARIAWTTEQGRQYLKEKFGKISRYQLTEIEAKEFLAYLIKIPNSTTTEVIHYPSQEDSIEVIHPKIISIEDEDDDSDKSWSLSTIRKTFPNAYKIWTKVEDDRLLELYQQGKSIRELAVEFGRQEGGIRSRLRKVWGIE